MLRSQQTIPAALAVALLMLGATGLRAEEKPTGYQATQSWTVGIGAQIQVIDGNERRFDQYVTPPAGFYLSRLAWKQSDPHNRLAADLYLRDIGEPGPSGELWLLAGNTAALRAAYRRSAFFSDFSSASDRTRRGDLIVGVGSPPGPGSRYSWQASFGDVGVRGRPAAGPRDWRTRNSSAVFGWRGDQYAVDVRYGREAFDFRTGGSLSGTTQTYGLSLASVGSQNTALTGSLQRDTTDLDGRTTGVDGWTAEAALTHSVRDNLSLSAEVRQRKIGQTITENAYARRNSSVRVEANYVPAPHLSAKGFWQTGQVDYVDGRQLNTITADTNTLGLDIKHRPSRELEWRARFRQRNVGDRPRSYTVANTLTNSLIYSAVRRTDVSFSFTPPSAPAGLTGQWQHDWWRNNSQGARNTVNTTVLTAWWQQPGGQLSANASFTHQGFGQAVAPDPVTHRGYASRINSFVFGLNYQAAPDTAFYAAYTTVVAQGANVDDYGRITVGANYTTPHGDKLLGELNVGSFNDLLTPALDYDADLLRVEWQRGF